MIILQCRRWFRTHGMLLMVALFLQLKHLLRHLLLLQVVQCCTSLESTAFKAFARLQVLYWTPHHIHALLQSPKSTCNTETYLTWHGTGDAVLCAVQVMTWLLKVGSFSGCTRGMLLLNTFNTIHVPKLRCFWSSPYASILPYWMIFTPNGQLITPSAIGEASTFQALLMFKSVNALTLGLLKWEPVRWKHFKAECNFLTAV